MSRNDLSVAYLRNIREIVKEIRVKKRKNIGDVSWSVNFNIQIPKTCEPWRWQDHVCFKSLFCLSQISFYGLIFVLWKQLKVLNDISRGIILFFQFYWVFNGAFVLPVFVLISTSLRKSLAFNFYGQVVAWFSWKNLFFYFITEKQIYCRS